VEDISKAFIAVLHAPRELVHNEAFNVGRNEENYQIRDIATIVGEVVPESTVTFAEEAGPDTRNYRVDCSKIQKILNGYKPTWTARKGAQELLDAYQRVGVTLEEFEGPRYKRVDHIKLLLDSGVIDSTFRRIVQ
jgi:nucleoside-diphosphate-sugar epimerase